MARVVHRTWQSGQFLATAPAYLDASVAVAWLTSADRAHARATAFIGDHLAAARELQVSLLVVDETLFRILRGLVAASRGVSVKQIVLGREFKQNPQLLASFTPNLKLAATYMTSWATLIGTNMNVDHVLASWFDRCGDVAGFHDAYHLSLAQHGGAQSFVTVDADFKTVVNLPVPMNVITL